MSNAPAASTVPFPVADRFAAILRHLHPERDRDQAWMQSAAALMVGAAGPPERLAHGLRGLAGQLKRECRWLEPERGPLRHLIAALLWPTGITAEAFLFLTRRDAERLHAAGAGLDEESVACACALRLVLDGAHGLPTLMALRIAHVQHVLSPHSWWLHRSRLLPLATVFALEHVDTAEIADRATLIHACAVRSGLDAGEALRRACLLLVLTGLEPAAATARLRALSAAFIDVGALMEAKTATLLALLCLLDEDPALIARTHQDCMARLRQAHPPIGGAHAALLAACLACCALERSLHADVLTPNCEGPPAARGAPSACAPVRRFQAVSMILQLERMNALQDQANLIA